MSGCHSSPEPLDLLAFGTDADLGVPRTIECSEIGCGKESSQDGMGSDVLSVQGRLPIFSENPS
jgi:hypothetical protein